MSKNFYLLVSEFLARVCLLWMIEPIDPDHHVAAPGFPHALDAANEGQVGPASRQEHCTVPDADHLSATDNGLIEKLLGLALHTTSLEVVIRGQTVYNIKGTIRGPEQTMFL